MQRREAIRLFPISLAGIAVMAQEVYGKEKGKHKGWRQFEEPLSLRYSLAARERLTWIHDTQGKKLMKAAEEIARTVEAGGQCYQTAWDAGHTESDSWPGRNGEPEIFSTSFDINKAKKGDLMLTTGQYDFTPQLPKMGVYVIGAPSPWSGDARFPELLQDDVRKLTLRPYANLFIENKATSTGGLVYVEGMPAPIGPVSGLVGKTTIWMMLADACRLLAAKGISRPVKGDEPKLKGDRVDYLNFAGWVDLNKPLMDDYFKEVIKQLDMVFAELGTIKKIAAMAVETTLNHGQIYGYSLQSSIAGEASTRRSGLSITEGVYGSSMDTPEKRRNFRGTSKDCVIMGITKPDDPIDLAFLDLFRDRGMKVASLGPMTRSIKVPAGRAVPKETDFHAGRMCDTYGLYAVKGFDQRICPTSGVVLDHLFWCTMMEVVEQYIERTGGDVPGVFFSAALKGGMEHMYRMIEVYRSR